MAKVWTEPGWYMRCYDINTNSFVLGPWPEHDEVPKACDYHMFYSKEDLESFYNPRKIDDEKSV